MTERRKAEVDRALDALKALFNKFESYKGQIILEPDYAREMVIVRIEGGVYEINVECDSAAAIIREVVNRVIYKV